MNLVFPQGFRWGTATAAYQIEGAATQHGRGPSIWDTFARDPGRVFAGHTGDIACDHYHRYIEDVALMRDLGMGTYRFSAAWPRIRPDGTGPANPAGLDFYDRLTDELLDAGIEPMLTLYHWDLPQALEDRGGWASRDTAFQFADYALTVHKRLGDRIDLWTTLNEPWCAAFLGYAAGVHAPGVCDVPTALAAAHHLLLAHGLATAVLRSAGAKTLSLTLNLAPVVPLSSEPDELDAADRVDAMLNRLFLEPVLKGAYEPYARDIFECRAVKGLVHDEDEAAIGQEIDLLGINYYNPCLVRARPGTPENAVYPGSEGVDFRPAPGKTTAMGWPIEPWGLTELLERLSRDYPGIPLIITENGAAFDDVRAVGGGIADHDRIAFLEGHLQACHEAISKGVDLRGYLVWSLLDNFEWAEGYRKRFGIVHVDFDTQARTPKESARWYAKVISRNGL